MNERKAIVPGTFDPVHYGHLDVLETAADMFDFVFWLIAENPTKQPRFPLHMRCEMMNAIIQKRGLTNVHVHHTTELLVDFCKFMDIRYMVRSFRLNADFEYEMQLAMINRKLCQDVQTIYVASKQEHLHISSTVVRLLLSGGGVSKRAAEYLPPEVVEYLDGRT